MHLMLAGIFVVAAGLISFELLTDYTRRATVTGFLSPESGSNSVTATRAGQLFIEVPSGAEVTVGDKLARIVGYDVDAAGRSLLELEIQGLEEALSLVGERLDLAQSRQVPLHDQEALALTQHQRDIAAAKALFEKNDNGIWYLRDGEAATAECKESFSGDSTKVVLLTIAGMANNMGGFLFFGVGDDDCEVVGLYDDLFEECDISRVTQQVKNYLAPTPNFVKKSITIDDKTVGFFMWNNMNSLL